jgi:invasion protein IalB
MTRRSIALTLLLAGSLGGAAHAQEPDRLSEIYGDWTVNCVNGDGGRQCAMVQTLTSNENGQRVLQAELATTGGNTRLILVAPFGVLLEAGVSATIEGEALKTIPYRTCIPAGCIAETQLTADEIAKLRRGATLALRLKAADSGSDVNLSLSLAGVSAALNRLGELTQ